MGRGQNRVSGEVVNPLSQRDRKVGEKVREMENRVSEKCDIDDDQNARSENKSVS